MKDSHGGVSVGSEVSGGIMDVRIENCQMDSARLDRALRIRSNSYRGGTVERIVRVEHTSAPDVVENVEGLQTS